MIDKQALIKRQMATVSKLSLDELKEKFEELYGFAPRMVNAETLRHRIAYRLQEIQFGGLPPAAAQFLDDLADGDSLANLEKQQARKYVATRGTRYIREWKGTTYEVIVQSAGCFEFNGRTYKSLSAIASEITGTHWNGKRFFGVD
jgi:hypothetical protein